MDFVLKQNIDYHNESGLCVNEKIKTMVYDTPREVSMVVADRIKNLIKQRESENGKCVLGLATGSTPCKVYDILCQMYKRGEVSFKNVYTFNLDEYYPMNKESVQSYYQFMHHHLFD